MDYKERAKEIIGFVNSNPEELSLIFIELRLRMANKEVLEEAIEKIKEACK